MLRNWLANQLPDLSRRSPRAILILPLLLALQPAHGIGLAEYEVQSALGQTLRLVVRISAQAGETIDAACFKIHPFTVANDGLPQLTSARLSLDKRGNQQRLIVTSARPIQDPIVRISIDIGCDTSLRRDLTVLLDPLPAIEAAAETAAPSIQGVAIAPATPPAAVESAAASGGAGPRTASGSSARASAAAKAGSGARPRASRQDSTKSAESKPADRAQLARNLKSPDAKALEQLRVRPSKSAAKQPRDRLSISSSGPPLESYPDAPILPRLMLSTTLGDRGSRPALSESVLSALRPRLERLKAAPVEEDIPTLEAEMVVLQKRTAEMRSQLDSTLARMAALRESAGAISAANDPATKPAPAESAKAAVPVSTVPEESLFRRLAWTDPLVAVPLGVVIILLLLGLGFWLRRERSESSRAKRWENAPYLLDAEPATPMTEQPPEIFGTEQESEPLASSIETSDAPPANYAAATRDSASEVGVSYLAQATEKANVFVSLGRPEQAIGVLRDHIDHEPQPSPMAWLMLLDLYRETNRQSEFLDISQRFHREFNAETPLWDQPPPQRATGLTEFPHLIRKIRDNWPKPEARVYIEELLHDNQGGLRVGFSLQAFRDLLLLHTIVDDHIAQQDVPTAIHRRSGAAPPPPPSPPPHLADVWESVMVTSPEFPEKSPRPHDTDAPPEIPEMSPRPPDTDAPTNTIDWKLPEVPEGPPAVRSTRATRGRPRS